MEPTSSPRKTVTRSFVSRSKCAVARTLGAPDRTRTPADGAMRRRRCGATAREGAMPSNEERACARRCTRARNRLTYEHLSLHHVTTFWYTPAPAQHAAHAPAPSSPATVFQTTRSRGQLRLGVSAAPLERIANDHVKCRRSHQSPTVVRRFALAVGKKNRLRGRAGSATARTRAGSPRDGAGELQRAGGRSELLSPRGAV